jgi:Ca2+-binding RTX toxin-like protein
VLYGGKGNDMLYGEVGNDVFAFARGDGSDTVYASSTDGADTIRFDGGIAHGQLWFQRTGNSLVVSVIGEGQSITVANRFASSANHVDSIVAGDGFRLSDAGIDTMMQAMAGLTPPSAGQTTLPAALATQLNPQLAANWTHP